MREFETVHREVKIGKVLNRDVERGAFLVEIRSNSKFLPKGRQQLTEEFVDFSEVGVIASLDSSNDVVVEKKEELQCSSCESKPLYDQKTEEHYCPLCD